MIKNLLLGNFQCLNSILDNFYNMLISIQLEAIILLNISTYCQMITLQNNTISLFILTLCLPYCNFARCLSVLLSLQTLLSS